jgi:hypothetical protein
MSAYRDYCTRMSVGTLSVPYLTGVPLQPYRAQIGFELARVVAACRLYSPEAHVKWEVQIPLLFGVSPLPSQVPLYQVRRVGTRRIAVLH